MMRAEPKFTVENFSLGQFLTPHSLQIGSSIFALVAALLWIRSATIPIPRAIKYVDAGCVDGTKEIDDVDRLTTGLYRQSKFSALAAIAAALAAAFQAVGALI